MKNTPPGGLRLPTTGKPLTTVHQINNAARRRDPIVAELAGGTVEMICFSRHVGPDFQVQLAASKQWVSFPRRVWIPKIGAAGVATTPASPLLLATPQSETGNRLCIQRTPVDAQTLDELQTLLYQVPAMLESSTGIWLITPQGNGRQLAFRRWRQTRALLSSRTLAALIEQMRTHPSAGPLLDQGTETPLRGWQIAHPALQSAAEPAP